LSTSFGGGSAYYNQLFGLAPPPPLISPMSLDQYTLLQTLYETMQAYDILTASTTLDDETTETNMEYVAGLASTSNIQFNVPNSKIIAPVPFGLTMEGIALRYLGDAQRWIEIATLNNLVEPYIDEEGFQLPLLSNAIGRQIIVASIDNLYIGQAVTLYGAGQTPSSRTIANIQELSLNTFLITLSGLANLGNFTLTSQAYLQVYLPGTVNSQQKIFIPSDLPAPEDNSIIQPQAATGDPLTSLSKVDLLLDQYGDIAVNNYGDFRLSYGITNIIQALKIKMATSAGTMLTHPDFGLGIGPGISAADVNAQRMYNQINTLIQADSRFSGVSSLQISLNGPQLNISMGVQLAGQNGVFPVNFQLT
jgi:hypothetical protein